MNTAAAPAPRSRVGAIVAFVLMVGVAVLSVAAAPTKLLSDTRPAVNLETAVPKVFGDWKIDPHTVPLPPSPDQAAAMNQIYDQVLSRTYINSQGQRVMLSIAYGSRQNQQMRAHRQEVCYSAQGFRIAALQRLPLKVLDSELPAARMVAKKGVRVEPVTYWFTMGDYAAMSYVDRELVQLRYAMQGRIPDGYLVRISNLEDKQEAQAFGRHQAFANELMAALEPGTRARLMGHSHAGG